MTEEKNPRSFFANLVDRVRGHSKLPANRRRDMFSTHDATNFSLLQPGEEMFLPMPEFGEDLAVAIRYNDVQLTADGALEEVDLPPVKTFDEILETFGQDAISLKKNFALSQGAIPDILFNWYATQSFIGFQACAIVSQQWLIAKALSIPAHDAFRNGFEIATDGGEDIDVEALAKLTKLDKKFKLHANLVQCEINRRRFGYRIVIFNVKSNDPDYYRKPFNIDAVTKGSYLGMTQVDPNWVSPLLDENASANPSAMNFYEPTWWMVAGTLYHHSHLEVVRYVQPADVLKPMYQYGGISLTQLILERVYAAERTANEAPMLVQTKRLNCIFTDLEAVFANPGAMEDRIAQLVQYRDNYAVNIGGLEDRYEQLDTSLSDLDDVIMTGYQLVAAIAEIPATKLLGTTPKGFAATGEYDEKNYHETLESIQSLLEPIVDHHHRLAIKSEMPDAFKTGDDDFEVVTMWHPVGSLTAKERAEVGLIKAQTDQTLIDAGVIAANESRNRIIADKFSGYNGIEKLEEMDFEDLEALEPEDLDPEDSPDDPKPDREEGPDPSDPEPNPDRAAGEDEKDISGRSLPVNTDPDKRAYPANTDPDKRADPAIGVIGGGGIGSASIPSGPTLPGGGRVGDPEPPGDPGTNPPGGGHGTGPSNPGNPQNPENPGNPNPPGQGGGAGDDPADNQDEVATEDNGALGYVRVKPSAVVAQELAVWAAESEVRGLVRPSELHVTIMNDATGLANFVPSRGTYAAQLEGRAIMLSGALVVPINSPELGARFDELVAAGARQDFPEYFPHMTFKYDASVEDVALFNDYIDSRPQGSLRLGREAIGVTG